MRYAVVVIAVCIPLACGREHPAPGSGSPGACTHAVGAALAEAGDTTALVSVDRPTVIGFFPPANDTVDAHDDGYSEGVAHVRFALEDAQACLGRDSARVTLVVDTAVRIRQGARTDTVRFSRIDSLSYGAYLLAPGREPRLIHAYGSSALIPAVTEAIPGYFHRGPCPAR